MILWVWVYSLCGKSEGNYVDRWIGIQDTQLLSWRLNPRTGRKGRWWEENRNRTESHLSSCQSCQSLSRLRLHLPVSLPPSPSLYPVFVFINIISFQASLWRGNEGWDLKDNPKQEKWLYHFYSCSVFLSHPLLCVLSLSCGYCSLWTQLLLVRAACYFGQKCLDRGWFCTEARSAGLWITYRHTELFLFAVFPAQHRPYNN